MSLHPDWYVTQHVFRPYEDDAENDVCRRCDELSAVSYLISFSAVIDDGLTSHILVLTTK